MQFSPPTPLFVSIHSLTTAYGKPGHVYIIKVKTAARQPPIVSYYVAINSGPRKYSAKLMHNNMKKTNSSHLLLQYHPASIQGDDSTLETDVCYLSLLSYVLVCHLWQSKKVSAYGNLIRNRFCRVIIWETGTFKIESLERQINCHLNLLLADTTTFDPIWPVIWT